LGENDLVIMIHLISNIYKTAKWAKDFTEVKMIQNKKPKSSIIAHTIKIIARIPKKRAEMKIVDLLAEYQF
jgi:hypothetical protein